MEFLAVLAAGYVAYAAPSHDEAYTAYTDRVLEVWREKGKYTYIDRIRKEPYFAADLFLERCEKRIDRDLIRPNGEFAIVSGYECIMEIWPNAFPSFRSPGFFYHDGTEWVYFGAIHQVPTPGLDEFSPLAQEPSTLKQGATPYDGYPYSSFYENYDPYNSLFELDDSYDAFNY